MLKMQKGVQDRNTHRIDKDSIIRKHLGKYNRKLELMVELKKSTEYIYSVSKTYGMEWEDFSPNLKEFLVEYAPKKAKKQEKVQEKVQESKKVKEESSDS